MNHYLITLDMEFGEFSKDSLTLIAAKDEAQAERKAIELEAHGALSWYQDGKAATDTSIEAIYHASRVRLIKEEDVSVLSQYMAIYTA